LLLLTNDPKTDVIVLYVEGVKDGRKFFEALRTASKHKVVVVLKAGKSEEGNKAAKSHTGNLAGNYLIYKAAFRQSGVIEVKNLSEAFGVLELMKQPLPKGNRVAVITNGGGFGVLTADAIANTSLTLAPLSKQTRAKLRAVLPPYLNVNNPIDVGGDADAQRYKDVLDVVYQDENVDVVIVDLLFQTSALNESVIDVIKSYADTRTKTTLAVSVGGRYSKEKRRIMSLAGIPSFPTPEHAVKSVERLVKWNGYLKTTV
jgi:acyl-CoA synthetase (NDP forming)